MVYLPDSEKRAPSLYVAWLSKKQISRPIDHRLREAMTEHFTENMDRYFAEHYREIVVIDGIRGHFRERFYKTRQGAIAHLTRAHDLGRQVLCMVQRQYGEESGSEITSTQLLIDEQDNRIMSSTEVCPFDGKILYSHGVHASGGAGRRTIYREHVHCPECEFENFRTPSRKTIKRLDLMVI